MPRLVGTGFLGGLLFQFVNSMITLRKGEPSTIYMYHLVLALLCVARVILTIKATLDINLIIDVLPETVHTLLPYLSIQLNDLVVIAIWVLIPILCGRSIIGQWGFLGMTSLRELFFEAFFTDTVSLLRPMPVLTILLAGVSAMYIPRLVMFIYTQWTYELAYLVQTLQFYPAVLMMIQTLSQGLFLLKAYGDPHFIKKVAHKNLRGCKNMLNDHIMLNVTFLVHCVCIGTVVEMLDFEQKGMIRSLAVGEVVYRFFAVLAFFYLMKKVERLATSKNLTNEKKEQSFIQKELVRAPPPGVAFLGDQFEATVDSSGKSVQWENHDISVVIPPSAIPEGIEAVVRGQCCIGPFLPPEGCKFVSPVYLVTTSCQFRSEVEATMSHFAYLNDESEDDCSGSMTFVTAASVPTLHAANHKPLYQFKPIPGGTFRPREATIRLKHCCFIGVVDRDSTGVLYTSIFWSPQEPLVNHPHAIFSVMPLCIEYENVLQERIRNQFPDEHFTTTPYIIDYSSPGEDAAVKLHIPHEAIRPYYKVVSDNPSAKISRSQVDLPHHRYRDALVDSSISYPPWITLTISTGDESPTQPLDCTLSVEGAYIARTTETAEFRLRLPHTLQPLTTQSHKGQPLPHYQSSQLDSQEVNHPLFEERPTIGELLLLKLRDGRKLRLIETIADKWKDLRDLFEIPSTAIDARQTPEDCCRDVFSKWMKSGSHNYPVTWDGLYRVLIDIQHRTAAKDLQTALLSSR